MLNNLQLMICLKDYVFQWVSILYQRLILWSVKVEGVVIETKSNTLRKLVAIFLRWPIKELMMKLQIKELL